MFVRNENRYAELRKQQGGGEEKEEGSLGGQQGHLKHSLSYLYSPHL